MRHEKNTNKTCVQKNVVFHSFLRCWVGLLSYPLLIRDTDQLLDYSQRSNPTCVFRHFYKSLKRYFVFLLRSFRLEVILLLTASSTCHLASISLRSLGFAVATATATAMLFSTTFLGAAGPLFASSPLRLFASSTHHAFLVGIRVRYTTWHM